MKHIKLIAAAALLMAAAPAFAVDWVYVAGNKRGADFYYDAHTIVRSGNQVTVWEKWDHSKDKALKEREIKLRRRYDCAERTVTLLHGIAYYPDGTNKSSAYETYEQEVTPIAPASLGEVMLEAVCEATAP